MWKLALKLFTPFIALGAISLLAWNIHDTIHYNRVYEAWQEIYIVQLEDKVSELEEELSTDGYVLPDSGSLVFPFYPNSAIRISSQFGTRTDPFDFDSGPVTEEKTHRGIDIVSEKQSIVLSTVSGFVVEHYPAPNGYWRGDDLYGGKIIIEDENGFEHVFGHFSETYVNTGDYVEAGDEIGRMGMTGVTTGPHLHYEIRRRISGNTFEWFDPLQYFDIRINDDSYVMFPEDYEKELTITGRVW